MKQLTIVHDSGTHKGFHGWTRDTYLIDTKPLEAEHPNIHVTTMKRSNGQIYTSVERGVYTVDNNFHSWTTGHDVFRDCKIAGYSAPGRATAKTIENQHTTMLESLLTPENFSDIFILTKDAVILWIGTENECYTRLQKVQSQSADWAIKHEGYEVANHFTNLKKTA